MQVLEKRRKKIDSEANESKTAIFFIVIHLYPAKKKKNFGGPGLSHCPAKLLQRPGFDYNFKVLR